MYFIVGSVCVQGWIVEAAADFLPIVEPWRIVRLTGLRCKAAMAFHRPSSFTRMFSGECVGSTLSRHLRLIPVCYGPTRHHMPNMSLRTQFGHPLSSADSQLRRVGSGRAPFVEAAWNASGS